ncbi:MAG: hypothetical protein WC091_09410 [Sulfuricellaceae bacterium]
MFKKIALGVAGALFLAQLAIADNIALSDGATEGAQTVGAPAVAAPAIVGTGNYVVKVKRATYAPNSGPRILVDDAHNNYSDTENRFKGFVDLMVADGARVTPLSTAPITAQTLAGVDTFVTCNPLNQINANNNNWTLPTPSAFTDDEIKAVQDWVKAGGALLLIADHMPFPGGAEKMAYTFGAVLQNAFVFVPNFDYMSTTDMNVLKFKLHPDNVNDSLLHRHWITEGRNKRERIDYVTNFTGHAFRMRPGVKFSPIMELKYGVNMLWPSDADVMTETTPSSAGDGLMQGVVLKYGKGRVGIFAEASMFSVAYANWNSNYPMGFQNPEAPYNQQFILNLMHWLNPDYARKHMKK